jgi:D-glycero-alpha-D-manno-heptose 1-phosphate guanylyltransferase
MQTMILVGGRGTRLAKVISDVPKPMAQVSGRPFLEYLLDYCLKQGLDDFIFSLGYKGEIIKNHFGNKYKNAKIEYAIENEPLGTGGAILNAMEKLSAKQTFLVLNGDTLVKFNLNKFYQHHLSRAAKLSVLLKRMPDCSRYGEAVIKNDTIIKFNYPGFAHVGLVNAGVYLIEPDLFINYDMPKKFSFESDFLYPYVDKVKPNAFVVDKYFIDIGVPEDYARFCDEYDYKL